jgi:lambda family phage portal protein
MKILDFFKRSTPAPAPIPARRPGGRRAYAAAAHSRLVSDWVAQATSMDSEVRGSLKALRNRSRQLGRDNDYVKSFFRECQNNIVGDGIPFQSQVRMERGGALNETVNKQIEEAFYRWTRKEFCHVAGELAFEDIERMIARAIPESGEIYIRKIRQQFGGSKVPLALEIIESDRVDDDVNGLAANGNDIVMGIEKDKWGRRTAYYIKQRHPGDYNVQSYNRSGNARTNIRIPADEIIALFVADRPGQTRGVPWLASTMMRLHQMQGYEEAEVIAARASASLMGFIESPEGELKEDDVEGEQRVTEFEPGVFKQMAPGEKVTVPDLHRPGGQMGPFMSFMLKGVAAGAGASYESISKDYSQANYSSSRLSLLSERDNWRAIQKWLIRNFHQAVFEEWLDMAVLAGVVKLKGYELTPEKFQAVKWMPRGWAWVDPAKEVAAYHQAVRGGMKTLTDIYAEEGKDFEEAMMQVERERKIMKKYGLIFDTDASVPKYGQGLGGDASNKPASTEDPSSDEEK